MSKSTRASSKRAIEDDSDVPDLVLQDQPESELGDSNLMLQIENNGSEADVQKASKSYSKTSSKQSKNKSANSSPKKSKSSRKVSDVSPQNSQDIENLKLALELKNQKLDERERAIELLEREKALEKREIQVKKSKKSKKSKNSRKDAPSTSSSSSGSDNDISSSSSSEDSVAEDFDSLKRLIKNKAKRNSNSGILQNPPAGLCINETSIMIDLQTHIQSLPTVLSNLTKDENAMSNFHNQLSNFSNKFNSMSTLCNDGLENMKLKYEITWKI